MADEQRTPAAYWERAFDEVHKLIGTLPSDTDRAAARNASIWRAVHKALEAANPIQPSGYDYASQPRFDVAPIERGEPDGVKWFWDCPRCGTELQHTPTHDEYTDGYAPQAVPDVYRCRSCPYEYAD